MKRIFFILTVIAVMAIASCGLNHESTTNGTNDSTSIDSVSVDTTTLVIDSI